MLKYMFLMQRHDAVHNIQEQKKVAYSRYMMPVKPNITAH